MYQGRGGWVVILVFGVTAAMRYFSFRRRRGTRGPAGFPGSGRSFTAGPRVRPADPGAAGSVVEPTSASGTAAGWFTDPFVRHEQRYWSGTAWTDQVADAGVPGTDPPPAQRVR